MEESKFLELSSATMCSAVLVTSGKTVFLSLLLILFSFRDSDLSFLDFETLLTLSHSSRNKSPYFSLLR